MGSFTTAAAVAGWQRAREEQNDWCGKSLKRVGGEGKKGTGVEGGGLKY